MALEKVSFGNCVIFALALAEVTSWTIDLPEVRKFFFENNAREKKYEEYKYKNGDDINGQVYYNNIEGNSKHNSKHYDDAYENTAYAREYGYQSYMEKKVHGIVYNGSVYLEGLRKSLENYTRSLEDCNRRNSSRIGTSLQSNATTWRPTIEFSNSTIERDGENSTERGREDTERCREVTRTSEHVRRLSELAMWATRELQDIAYARKYNKGDYHDLTKEENELILKLAWFLDRLAHYTGYEPEPSDFVETGDTKSTSTSTTPAPASLVSPPVEVKRAMMECLELNSSQPAVDRCRYPAPLPPLVRMMMEMNSNISGIPTLPTSPPSSSEQVVPIVSESRTHPISEQSMELLIAADYRTPSSNLPPYSNFAPILSVVRNVQKRSISSMPKPELLQAPKFKRSIEDAPAINFLKYYAKHKVWEGSNMNIIDTKTFEEYEVKNQLGTHRINKRAIDYKKSKHLRLPEDPFQDLSKYIKHKPGVKYVKDETQAEAIRAALEKVRNSKPISSKKLIRKLTKMFRQKRTVEYDKFEKNVDLPRKSEEPQKDISYYVKNKSGRNYNNDLVQALRVRTGLEQIFNTGNIEVVRRYGTNYNPLIPAPFFAGVLKTMSDF